MKKVFGHCNCQKRSIFSCEHLSALSEFLGAFFSSVRMEEKPFALTVPFPVPVQPEEETEQNLYCGLVVNCSRFLQLIK